MPDTDQTAPSPMDDPYVRLAVACSVLTVGLPFLGFVLMPTGFQRDGGVVASVLLFPLFLILRSAPFGLIVPLASLVWLNVALLRAARR